MKKIISLLLATAIITTSAGFVMAEENTVTLYVAPYGSDDAAGTAEKPLKTLDGARLAVRKINDGTKKIDVVFRGGEYRMSKTVAFTGADSGTKDYPVTYKAYEGETPVFKGSVELDLSQAKQVTDKAVLAKMYESVRNKVVEIDLAAQGITKDMLRDYTATYSGEKSLNGGEVNGLYSNGVPQTLAEWPNGFGNYSTWDMATDANTFHYTDTAPHRWGDAKYLYVGGYNQYDYAYIRKTITGMDINANTISCYSGSGGFVSAQSRRWKIYNLLEEIDVPGEYYIDPDTMKLYWYPENGLLNVKLEMAVLRTSMMTATNLSNVLFENLTFSHTATTAIQMKQLNDVDFIGCTFKDIQVTAMYVYSDNWAETDKDYWQRNRIDGSYNCDVLDCRFENIGRHAMETTGGNVDTLTSSNNRIENNIFTRCSQLAKNATTVMISGVGYSVKYNQFSDLPFHAINIWGNDHEITYNEIYDVVQESDDCGAIYGGRNTHHRGHEIAYNYIHDIKPVRELVYGFQGAIYFDDRFGGVDIHHNIIKGANVGLIMNGGVDINYSNNTMIDIDKYNMHIINGGIAANANTNRGYYEGYIADPSLYYSRYEHLEDLIRIGNEHKNMNVPEMAKYNTVTGNLSVDTTPDSIGTNTLEYGKVKGNSNVEECNDFVNPEAQDYRVKLNSETYKTNPDVLNENFDLDQIGLQDRKILEPDTTAFSMIYPKNGEDAVNCSSVCFKWQDARGANRYKLVIATDKELQNIVHEETSYYNVVNVENLKNDTIYYWKVTAENISRTESTTWEASGPVFSFRTSLYESIDTAYLDEVLKQTEEDLSAVDIGDNPGQYSQKTIESIKSLVGLSSILSNARIGTISQKNIDSMANAISGSLGGLGITNKGFIDISKYFNDAANWSKAVEIKDDTVTVSKAIMSANNVGINNIHHMSGSVLYSFEAKLDITSAYIIFSENKDNKIAPYSAANPGYSFLFKPTKLELQVTSGTKQTIPIIMDQSIANDGKFHKFQYGFIRTDVGNFALLYIDGEPIIEYFDVIDPAVNVPGGFMIHIANDYQTLTMRPTENIGTQEEFTEIINDCYYKSVKTVMNAYAADDVIAIDGNCNKAFTPKGVYNIEGTQNINSKLYMRKEVIEKILSATSTQNGNAVTVTSGDKTAVVTVNENGLISLEDVTTQLGRGYTYSEVQNLVIIGDIIFMNNQKPMNRTRQLMDIMETIEAREDYIFDVAN